MRITGIGAVVLVLALARPGVANVFVSQFFSSPSATILEGQELSQGVLVGWSRIFDSFSGEFRWGDGTTTGVPQTTSTYAYRTRLYPDDGTFSVSFFGTGVEYSIGALGRKTYYGNAISASTTVRVVNIAPTITSITSDRAIYPGQSLNLFASATDPGVSDVLIYRWALNGFPYLDGQEVPLSLSTPGEHVARLTVDDGDGGIAMASVKIAVARPLAGDINLDQVVDEGDFVALHANFGGTGATWSNGDVTGDGLVNFADFQVVERMFGQRVEPLDVGISEVLVAPEPGAAGLLALGLMVTWGWRRRARLCRAAS